MNKISLNEYIKNIIEDPIVFWMYVCKFFRIYWVFNFFLLLIIGCPVCQTYVELIVINLMLLFTYIYQKNFFNITFLKKIYLVIGHLFILLIPIYNYFNVLLLLYLIILELKKQKILIKVKRK